MDIVFLLPGAVLGLIASFLLVYIHFKDSIANQFVKLAVETTEKFHNADNTDVPKDTYKYDLSVIIDDLSQIGDDGRKPGNDAEKSERVFPLLVGDNDRWERFDKGVKPIIDTIKIYSILATFGWLNKDLGQLKALSKLCLQIKFAVMALDTAFAGESVVEFYQGGIAPKVGKEDDGKVKAVERACVDLHTAWKNWKNTIGIEESKERKD